MASPCIKLLHEAEGHVVTVELTDGTHYRGEVSECQDNMNMQMQNVTYVARDGRVSKLENVYIRGSNIRLLILPDMLKHAALFKSFDPKARKTGTS